MHRWDGTEVTAGPFAGPGRRRRPWNAENPRTPGPPSRRTPLHAAPASRLRNLPRPGPRAGRGLPCGQGRPPPTRPSRGHAEPSGQRTDRVPEQVRCVEDGTEDQAGSNAVPGELCRHPTELQELDPQLTASASAPAFHAVTRGATRTTRATITRTQAPVTTGISMTGLLVFGVSFRPRGGSSWTPRSPARHRLRAAGDWRERGPPGRAWASAPRAATGLPPNEARRVGVLTGPWRQA